MKSLNELQKEFMIEEGLQIHKAPQPTELPADISELRPEPLPVNVQKRKNRRLRILSDVIFYTMLVILLIWAVTFSQNGTPGKSLFGFRYYNVLTDSMADQYPRGSFILCKETAPEDIKVGDDITFYIDSVTTVTHRVIGVEADYMGSPGVYAYETKGTSNLSPDSSKVLSANVAGKVVFGIPYLGLILSYIANNMWLVIVIFLLAMVLSFTLRIVFADREKKKKPKSDFIKA